MSLKHFFKKRKSIIVIAETTSVMDAIDKMIGASAGAVLVGSDAKPLIGIVTERDVMTKVTAKKLDPSTTPLRQIMTADPVTISEDASIEEAINIMSEYRIRHLPVLNDDGEISGMISLRHLLHDRIQDLTEGLSNLEAYWNDAPGG